MADGGGLDNTKPVQPKKGPTTIFTYRGKPYEFAVADPDKVVTSKGLAQESADALTQHLSLPYLQQIASTKSAASKLAPYVGREDDGSVKPFLTMNAKLEKAGAGYEAGKTYGAQAPLTLPEGYGVETIGMALSPAHEHNKFKVCPNSAACRDDCLGVTSGNYANASWWPRQNSKNRTQAFLSEPGALAVQLHNEIQLAKHAAASRGNKLAVRLNVLSDIDPRVHEALIKSNPDVDFYDYTKMNYDPIAPNHHYTYSSTGVSQPEGMNGVSEGVTNKNQNWKQMRQRLDTGSNVAMVFSHHEHLPREVHDVETGKVYKVIDGTTHDYRPLDAQPQGADGVIIGLRNLNKKLSSNNAHVKSNGFVVHYDPQLQMETNPKTGKPTGKPVRGPSPGVDKNGRNLPGETVPQNYRVSIAPQNLQKRASGGQVSGEHGDMHPDAAIHQFHNLDHFTSTDTAPLPKGHAPIRQYEYGGVVEGDRKISGGYAVGGSADDQDGPPQSDNRLKVAEVPGVNWERGDERLQQWDKQKLAVRPGDKGITYVANNQEDIDKHLGLTKPDTRFNFRLPKSKKADGGSASLVDQALKLTSKSGAMLPASVYSHAQQKPGRR
jgi:hypothetical protein